MPCRDADSGMDQLMREDGCDLRRHRVGRVRQVRADEDFKMPVRALLQTWGTAARRHPVGGLGSIGEMLIEHNHGFGQGRGSNSECSFNQAHLPHDTWLQAPCLGLSFA